MEFKQLEAFVNVVKYKNFSKAAEATFLTQPTISTHISCLEKELGVTLIDRHGKESRPTKEGRAFYNYAINILNTRERALSQMRDSGKEITGTLEIRTSTIPGEYLVPELIMEFHKEYPNTSFNIEESDSNKVWNDIIDNLGEIGFTGTCEDNSLKYQLLSNDKLLLITPDNEKYRKYKENNRTISINDIKDEKYIWREEGSATRRMFEEVLYREAKVKETNAICTVNSINTIKELVKKGMGVSVCSKLCVKENEGYLIFEIEGVKLDREFYMVTNKNTILSPIALAFKNFVEKKYYKEK